MSSALCCKCTIDSLNLTLLHWRLEPMDSSPAWLLFVSCVTFVREYPPGLLFQAGWVGRYLSILDFGVSKSFLRSPLKYWIWKTKCCIVTRFLLYPRPWNCLWRRQSAAPLDRWALVMHWDESLNVLPLAFCSLVRLQLTDTKVAFILAHRSFTWERSSSVTWICI